MSIAVRVSVWILGVLVLVSAAVAVLALMQKQTLQGQNQSLHNQIVDDQNKIADLTTKAKNFQDQADQLNTKITQVQQEKTQIQTQFEEAKKKGIERISLETGSLSYFAPARKLYEQLGFQICGPFGNYILDPNSVYMTKLLIPDKAAGEAETSGSTYQELPAAERV